MYDHVHQWAKLKGTRLTRALYSILAVVTCFAIIYVLLRTTSFLPPFGNPDNPVNNEVSQRYIEQGMQETGAVNIVAGMILDYRAFDTLGESNVLFIAACSVLILLRISREKDGSQSAEQLLVEANDRMYEPKNDTILQHVTKLLVPIVLLFGMYVIMNGHISPGGGFSGGALMGRCADFVPERLRVQENGTVLHLPGVPDRVPVRTELLCGIQGVFLLHRRQPSVELHHSRHARQAVLRRLDSVPEPGGGPGGLLHHVCLLYPVQKGGHVTL